MGKVQKEGRWVPHELSEDNENRQRATAHTLLSKFRQKHFLHNIITGDEKWILCDNLKRRKSWLYFGQPSASRPKPNIHAKKGLLCIWWDWKDLLYYELLQPGEIITANRCQQQLTKLSNALEAGHFLGKDHKVIVLHDNARSHVANVAHDHIFPLG